MPDRTSSTFSVRMAPPPPPVRPSRSLEGMEKVIPPTMKNPFSPFHSELFLNKPLPAMPLLPDQTAEQLAEGAFWSDSSDDSETESTVDSSGEPSEPRHSTELYPILISSGSNDFVDLVDHPAPSSTSADHLGPLDHQSAPRFLTPESRADSADSDSSFILQARSISEVQYGRPAHWPQRNHNGSSHYFREKKWDFFPELADPSSAAQLNGRGTPSLRNGKSGKKDGRLISLDLSKGGRHRWKSLDSRALGGMRDSIKTYVNRTLSKGSAEDAGRQRPPVSSPLPSPTRPTTAPLAGSPFPEDSSPRQSDDGGELLSNKVFAPQDSGVELRTMSVSTQSSVDSDLVVSPKTNTPPRQKQLAVPLSPYQKYGATVWEKETPKSAKKRSVRFPQYATKTASPTTSHNHRTSVSTTRASVSSRKISGSSATHHPNGPLSPPQRMQHQGNPRGATRTLQDGKSHLLVATRRIIQSKEDRRREQLKAQIKHFGPLGSHGYNTVNQWT